MKIGGFQPFSLSDYPGYISAIIFTQGCNFRCPYCHNPSLVLPEFFGEIIPEEEIFSFLIMRKSQLEGVVITGGEPTLHTDLPDFIKRIKSLNYRVKLDTNGTNPEMVEELISNGLIDYCSMDIKTRWENYSKVAHVPVEIKKIKKTINILLESPIQYEFRITYDKSLISEEDLKVINSYLPEKCILKIQHCRDAVTLNSIRTQAVS